MKVCASQYMIEAEKKALCELVDQAGTRIKERLISKLMDGKSGWDDEELINNIATSLLGSIETNLGTITHDYNIGDFIQADEIDEEHVVDIICAGILLWNLVE